MQEDALIKDYLEEAAERSDVLDEVRRATEGRTAEVAALHRQDQASPTLLGGRGTPARCTCDD